MDSQPSADRHVFLGQPGYGELTAGSARAFWRATRLPESQVYPEYRQGSLLAANFNSLWVSALNLAHRGKPLTHFAMIHADVEPQDYWLDTLIDEMESRDLDMLGAVVPIKDSRGVTSIALDRPDKDTWRPLCRLTMNEIHRLPATFTSDDVGHPLLLNTGLWVCRFDLEWARKVRFTINDRIVFDTNNDRYMAQCEPEDWYFSRLCHEIGLKIGATRKVHLHHRGPASFSNHALWGEPYDSTWIDASPVPDDLPGFKFPHDVPGWLSFEEGRQLARLARGKRVLEIGSYYGRSTICLAQTAEHVDAVDTWDGRGTPEPRDTRDGFEANISRYGVANRVRAIAGPLIPFHNNPDPVFQYFTPSIDLAFIDGAHDAESVRNDINVALGFLKPDGLLAFHDYHNSHDPDVTTVIDEFIDRGGELLSLTGTVAVVRPPAPIPQSQPEVLEV